uniref:Glycosyl transferase family 25 domain-containing protein n=1 Tax=Megaviridae environmental sample TaxID=1737588 RepID=A0A5J6VL30_9VIRU|nr:MAG: hypothetical protein [Megaviridae environmental sample]
MNSIYIIFICVFLIFIIKRSLYGTSYIENYTNTPLLDIKNTDVYVLYIPKREIYIKNIINKLFLNPKYIRGVNKNELNKEDLIKNGVISKNWSENGNININFNFGRVACFMGHTLILKKFLLTDKKYALIYEDDIKVNLSNINTLKYKIKTILKNIPSDADIVYLSFCWEDCDRMGKVNHIFSKSYEPLCRHHYLVSKNGARIILNNTKLLKAPCDIVISNLILNKKLVSYNVNPDYINIGQNREHLGSNLGNIHKQRCCK